MGGKKPVRAYVKKTGKVVPSHLRTQPIQRRQKAAKVMFGQKPPTEEDSRPGQGWVTTQSNEKIWIGPKVNLSGKNLSGLSLKNANLEQANLERVLLNATDLRGANLRGVSLVNAKIKGAQMGSADLRGITWKNVNIKDFAETLVDEDDIFSLNTTKYDKHTFSETAQAWGLSEKRFEEIVVAGAIEIRENESHAIVLERYNPWEHHVAGWQYQNPPVG